MFLYGITCIAISYGLYMIYKHCNTWLLKSDNSIRLQHSGIMVLYPHTSLKDTMGLFTMRYKYKINFYFLGKNKHYYGKWYSPIFRFLCPNMIPTDSSEVNTEYITNKLNSEKGFIVIASEGTREYVKYWKKGFYYISLNTSLPIVFNFACYKNHITYHSEPIYAKDHTIEEVMEIARQFYGQYDLTYGRNKDKIGDIDVLN